MKLNFLRCFCMFCFGSKIKYFESRHSNLLNNSFLSLGLQNIMWLDIIFALFKYNTYFSKMQFTEVCVIDYPQNQKRFELNYQFVNIKYNIRLLLNLFLPATSTLISGMAFFKNLNWSEREVWDLFGIFFTNHSDLRRLLTDYSFIGFPLRKNFPLSGYIELRYSEETNIILYETLELTQDFRLFFFASPWERITS